MTHKTRRGRGEGSIYQRGDGYWVGQLDAGHYPNGRRRYARVVRAKRAEVVPALNELRQQLDAGAVPDRTSTVEKYLTFWLDEVAATEVAPSSLAEYRKRIRRVTPVIGRVKLHRLTTAHVQRLANQLTETYPTGAKTVRTTLETLRSALRWALNAGMIARNPAEGVKGRAVPIATVDDTLTATEARAVVTTAEGTDMAGLVYLATYYGLRLGELLDLRWSDVDLRAGTLVVRKGKTAAAARELPLTGEAAQVMRAHRRTSPVTGTDGYVFPTSTGRRRSPQRTRDEWNDVLRAAGITHLCRLCETPGACSSAVRRFHSSRHTAATLLLESGTELEVVSAILGHASITITASIYAKVRADAKRRGLTRITSA